MYKRICQIALFVILFAFPLFQSQINIWIIEAILLYALLLLPYFFKNISCDIQKMFLATIFFLLFLFVSILSTIFSINPTVSFLQLILYVSYFVIFVSVQSVFYSIKSQQLLAASILAATILPSLLFLFNLLLLNSPQEQSFINFTKLYYAHNHFSALLIFTIPLAYYFFKETKQLARIVLLSIFLFLLLTLFFTLARASLLSLIGATLFSLLLFKRISLKTFGMISIIMIIIVISTLQIHTNNIVHQLYKKQPLALQNARTAYWKEAIYAVWANPKTAHIGSGLNTFAIAMPHIIKPHQTAFAHNFFFQMLSDTGIYGFFISLMLVISVVWNSTRATLLTKNSQQKLLYIYFFIGILASTLNNLVDFSWQLPIVFFVFWIVSGCIRLKTIANLPS